MKKIKLASLSWLGSAGDMFEIFRENFYSREKNLGFDSLEHRADLIRSRFVEHVLDTYSYTDPFGEDVISEISRYVFIDFSIYEIASGHFLVSILNPPKSVKNLIKFLGVILGGDFSIKNVNINLLLFVDLLKAERTVDEVQIRRLRLMPVTLGKNTVGKIDAMSSSDVTKDMEIFFPNQVKNITYVLVNIYYDMQNVKIEISKTATFSGEDEIVDSCVDIIIQLMKDKTSQVAFL